MPIMKCANCSSVSSGGGVEEYRCALVDRKVDQSAISRSQRAAGGCFTMNAARPHCPTLAYAGPVSHNMAGFVYESGGGRKPRWIEVCLPPRVVIVRLHLSTFGRVTAHQRRRTCWCTDHTRLAGPLMDPSHEHH